MKAGSIAQEGKNLRSASTIAVAKKAQYSSVVDFMKGTTSGDELVKHVCNRLDEKYGTSELRGLR